MIVIVAVEDVLTERDDDQYRQQQRHDTGIGHPGKSQRHKQKIGGVIEKLTPGRSRVQPARHLAIEIVGADRSQNQREKQHCFESYQAGKRQCNRWDQQHP
jgi:hypothetical protein